MIKLKNLLKENASRTAMEIGGYTGLNKNAVQKFVDDNKLDIEKLYQYVKKGKLPERMNLVSAIAGRPNNPIQKKMIKMFGESVNEEFKSKDSTFEKVYSLFDKKDYFNAKGLAKTQIGNFERALQRNDKGAQEILDKFKGDVEKAKEYIIQVISDQKKAHAFEDYKALKGAIDSIQKGKPEQGAVNYVKRIIHNNNQKYSIALYSELRGKKFNNYKDIHADVDSLLGESVINEADYQVYHKSFTDAADAARKMAEKRGFEIDEDDWQTQVALGGKNLRSRPSVGKETRFTVGLIKNGKPQRKALNFQVYGMKNGYELNAYIN